MKPRSQPGDCKSSVSSPRPFGVASNGRATQPPRSPQPVQCDTARSTLPTQGSLGIDGLGVSAIDPQGRNLKRVGRSGGGWRRRGGLQSLLLGERSRTISCAGQGSTALCGAELRRVGLVEPFSDVMRLRACFAQFSPGKFGIISTSSSSGRRSSSCSCDSLEAFGRISHAFYVKMNSDPEVDAPFALENLGHDFNEPFVSGSQSPRMRQSTVAFGRISRIFPREGLLGS